MTDNHPPPETRAVIIDGRGLACPLPVLKLRKVLNAQPPGTVVELLATDRAAERDVPAFCTGQGHHLLSVQRDGDLLRFTVRKG